MSHIFKRVIHCSISLIVLQLLSLFKVNLIIGSTSGFFSGFALFGPMIGIFGGLRFSTAVLLLRSLVKFFICAVNPLNPLLYHVPTLCASIYWRINLPIVRIGLPLGCILLFNFHPIGINAWFYSLYWIIPIVTAFIAERSVFAKALGSTFTAHAVGSVFWLYCIPMTAQTFVVLLPIVIIERLVLASGMVCIFYAGNYLLSLRATMPSLLKNQIFTKAFTC